MNKFIYFLIVFVLISFNIEAAETSSSGEKVKIGKVLKVKKGKGFGNEQKLKKKQSVETNTKYTTLAGGDLHLMLDSKTRIFIGSESEIIIKKFNIPEKKVHKVEIELITGSFLYKSLRKTSTDLKVIVGDIFIDSAGIDTSVALIKNKTEIRFVNAGNSSVTYKDKSLTYSEYAVLDIKSKMISILSIDNKHGDALIGGALDDFSMTEKGQKSSGGSGEGSSGGSGGDTGGGCG